MGLHVGFVCRLKWFASMFRSMRPIAEYGAPLSMSGLRCDKFSNEPANLAVLNERVDFIKSPDDVAEPSLELSDGLDELLEH